MIYLVNLYQVRQLLVDDPGNSEYADMEKELTEVILAYALSYVPFFFIHLYAPFCLLFEFILALLV